MLPGLVAGRCFVDEAVVDARLLGTPLLGDDVGRHVVGVHDVVVRHRRHAGVGLGVHVLIGDDDAVDFAGELLEPGFVIFPVLLLVVGLGDAGHQDGQVRGDEQQEATHEDYENQS